MNHLTEHLSGNPAADMGDLLSKIDSGVLEAMIGEEFMGALNELDKFVSIFSEFFARFSED